MSKNSKSAKSPLLVLLFFVLLVRIIFLGLFHDQVFLGPSTLFDQSYVAINILDGQGIKTFKSPPQSVNPSETTQLIDPENYVLVSPLLIPYVKDVTGYAFFLAFLWLLSGSKLWIFAQIVQILFDVVVALGLFYLAKKYFGKKAAYFSVFVFSILFFEARASIVPYKDIFNLYIMLAITLLASLIFFQKSKKSISFLCICLLAGFGYYFMPSIVLYPFFLLV
ncbi:MAG: glycosyltransferase family 39 protein, partial [Candidatus Aminicenantes bacterium]|nr:glycosyltransferase family 39 protein [Candidatus Aminicenantes bacterium]